MTRILPILTFLIIACGGKSEEKKETTQTTQTTQTTTNLAEEGKKLFQTKGCVACHYADKERSAKLVGPGLKDIHKERSEEWLIAMITNPDSMLKNDSIAKALLKEYGTPMTNQNVSVEEAKAIIEYIKSLSGGS
ncbi:MAG: cytochrome c [candidate division WOR-3 bacterium]|jgi:cytochrome c551/c552